MNLPHRLRLCALLGATLTLSVTGCKDSAPDEAPQAGTPPPLMVAPTAVAPPSDSEILKGIVNGEDRAMSDLSPEEQKQVMNRIIQERAKQQANGLGTGSLKPNQAWNYTGYSYLSPNPETAIEARMVAVDITLTGHTADFDIDDVEIVDSKTFASFGSDPHVEFLSLDGKLMKMGDRPAPAPRASRWLLIYAFPKSLDEFRLFYWGRQLTAAPVKIDPDGWEIPYPKAAAE